MKIRISLIIPLLFIFYFVSGQPAEIIYQGNLVKAGFDNDVAYGPFNIGFNFTYYGSSWSQFYISSNGLVTFGEGSTDPSEDPIPTSGTPENMIAVFWDDLSIDPSGNILYTTVGAAPNRKLIIQFRNMGFYFGPVYLGTFSVVLYETTNRIQTQYRLLVLPTSTAVHGGSATFGIENSDGTEGVQYAWHNSSAVTSGKAISYTPSGSTYILDPDAIYDGVYLTTNLTLPEPGIATLVSPADGAIIGSAHTFQWSESSNAGSYTLRVSRFANLSGATTYDAGSGTSYTVSGLTIGITYYWGVFATNATGTTWSEIKRFTTSDIPPLVAVPQTVWVEQNQEKTIKLSYAGGDASSKTAIIASLPAQGHLYQYNAGVRGAVISSVPATITEAGLNVIYLANGTTGNGAGNFNFRVQDGTGNSADAVVTVNVSSPGMPNLLHTAKADTFLELQFDRIMSNPSGRESQFTVTIEGLPSIITSLSLKDGDPYTIIAALSASLVGIEVVTVAYTAGDVSSAVGGLLASFSEQVITLLSQTITFNNLLPKQFGEPPFNLSATASSGLSLTYSSANQPVVTISGVTATILSIGSSDITARQAGNAVYAPARYTRTQTVTESTVKTLQLTSVLLQGLYNGTSSMRQAYDENGPRWPAGIADHITLELHNAASYGIIEYSVSGIPLGINGTATVTIPSSYSNSYFITIKHRNSLETTTSVPISFDSNMIIQSFGDPSTIFGGNLGLSDDSQYLIYTGDVNQDGYIDTQDYADIDNDSYNYLFGYLVSDVDANGMVDTNDYIFVDNNNYNYIGTAHP